MTEHPLPAILALVVALCSASLTAASTTLPDSSIAPMDERTRHTLRVLEDLQFQLERQLGDFITLSTTLKHRQDPALPYNIAVDEAIIRLGNDDSAVSLTTGKTAVPFALLDSSRWLENDNPLYDSRADNVMVLSSARGRLEGDLYLFKGDGDSDERQHNGGLNLRYTPHTPLTLEAGYLNNISNTGFMNEAEQIPAVRLGATLNAGALQLNSEYIQTDKVTTQSNQRPALSHLNLHYELDSLMGTPTRLGLGYSLSNEADFLDLNERHGVVSMQRQINDDTILSIELERRQNYREKAADSLSLTLDTRF